MAVKEPMPPPWADPPEFCPECGAALRFDLGNGSLVDLAVPVLIDGTVALYRCPYCLGAWTLAPDETVPAPEPGTRTRPDGPPVAITERAQDGRPAKTRALLGRLNGQKLKVTRQPKTQP